jgi:hypothetical protein
MLHTSTLIVHPHSFLLTHIIRFLHPPTHAKHTSCQRDLTLTLLTSQIATCPPGTQAMTLDITNSIVHAPYTPNTNHGLSYKAPKASTLMGAALSAVHRPAAMLE